MRIINEKLKETIEFLEHFDNAWRSSSIPDPPKNFIQKKLPIADDLMNNSGISSELFNLEKAGVTYGSDLLTYIFTSRLGISLEEKLKNNEKLDSVNKFWLGFVNYLLITNVFSPNEGIDQKDLGTGRYAGVQSKIRKEVTREILLQKLENRDPAKIMEYIIENGRMKRGNAVSLYKSRLKEIGRNLGLGEKELDVNKDPLKEKITSADKEKISEWIRDLAKDSEVWKGLAKKFVPLKTPGFLLKNVGLARELFVFLKLVYEDLGYVIPLLLDQRLYSRLDKAYTNWETPKDRYVLYPPDFLLARQGKIFGLELGRGKPEQISTFASVSGIPTGYISPHFGNSKLDTMRDFGIKCNLCFLCFTLCKKYISMFPNQLNDFKQKTCSDLCGSKKARDCPDSVVKTEVPLEEGETKETIVHYQCLKENYPERAEKINDDEIFPLYPKISGLEKLKLGFK